jgi:hypothetical protein
MYSFKAKSGYDTQSRSRKQKQEAEAELANKQR